MRLGCSAAKISKSAKPGNRVSAPSQRGQCLNRALDWLELFAGLSGHYIYSSHLPTHIAFIQDGFHIACKSGISNHLLGVLLLHHVKSFSFFCTSPIRAKRRSFYHACTLPMAAERRCADSGAIARLTYVGNVGVCGNRMPRKFAASLQVEYERSRPPCGDAK